MVGFHLGQAYRNHVDISLAGDRMRGLAAEAAGHLVASGARASARGDVPAAAALLERALGLMPVGAPQRTQAETLFGATLLEVVRLAEAAQQSEEVVPAARHVG